MAIHDSPLPPIIETISETAATQPPEELTRITGFPIWIKLSAIAIGGLVLFSLATGFSSLTLALHQARGERYLLGGNYQAAKPELKVVEAKYPANVDIQLDLVGVSLHEGDMRSSFQSLRRLSNGPLDSSQRQLWAQLWRIFSTIEGGAPKSGKAVKSARRGGHR